MSSCCITYSPNVQFSAPELPIRDEVFSGHGEHSVAAVPPSRYIPRSHSLHEDDPALSWNDP
eukprot:CAMPEP_0181327374 /NCGR_PEP_ID=MMETSP1101-20121128/22066_1 /TAXON_ID=46948 /ORGANISM="Rhodomonas abbreviata, Strain Caron Lab Isolate" /LENGTH=61 /DNA_ID=CAMNT_0023436027 /DNA_START=321 /DNA_END=506 /DNA_ORIENTATION=+